MKSKQSNPKKHFISTPYPLLPTFSINWGDKTNINIAVDIPTNALVANILSPYIQIRGNNVSVSHGQDINTSTMILNIKSMVIPYSDN